MILVRSFVLYDHFDLHRYVHVATVYRPHLCDTKTACAPIIDSVIYAQRKQLRFASGFRRFLIATYLENSDVFFSGEVEANVANRKVRRSCFSDVS